MKYTPFVSILVIGLTAATPKNLLSAEAAAERRREDLAILNQGFPRTIFFRNAEALAVENMPAAEFDARIQAYDGLIVKAFDEEKYGLSRYALPYFRAHKERHPEQLLLLHFNGAGRDPRPMSASPEFFAGHWLHYAGCRIAADLAPGDTQARVEDPGLFQMATGKRHKLPDDVTLCGLRADGTPDWNVFEYAKIAHIDAHRRTLTLQRGMFGSTARAWRAGTTYIAAIVAGGSFPMEGDRPQALWTYNFSVAAPRDTHGKRLIEVLTEDIAAKLRPGGPGDYFDGITFDVMPWEPPQKLARHMERAQRGQDTDGDGKPDFGLRDGVNEYGAGIEEFLVNLREQWGPDRLILRDAGRRAGPTLNGVESEGWPTPFDLEIREWSSGINDHRFWQTQAARPRLSYIHYKYAERRDGEDNRSVRLPYARARLVLAVAQMLGEPVTTNNGPPPEKNEPAGLFDELKMGVERRAHWLGQPLEPARALALEAPDLLADNGAHMTDAFQARVSSGNATIVFDRAARPPLMRAAAQDPAATSFGFRLTGIPLQGPDVVVSFRVKAAPMRGMPTNTARRVTVKPCWPEGTSVPPEVPGELWTWAGSEWFEAHFHYRGLRGATMDFILSVEDSGELCLADIRARARPDVMTREFEHGLVLVNPSLQPFTFDLDRLYPERCFRRLQGSAAQDPTVNNGEPVGATVTLEPRDGLFLVKTHRSE